MRHRVHLDAAASSSSPSSSAALLPPPSKKLFFSRLDDGGRKKNDDGANNVPLHGGGGSNRKLTGYPSKKNPGRTAPRAAGDDDGSCSIPCEIDCGMTSSVCTSPSPNSFLTKWAIAVVAILVLSLLAMVGYLAATLATASNDPGTGSTSTGSVEAMAAQIVQLSHEIGTSKEQVHLIEREESEIQAELERQRAENERLKKEFLEKTRRETSSGKGGEGGDAGGNANGKNLRTKNDKEEGHAVSQKLRLQVEDLQKSMQEHDREEIRERWGDGPYTIQVNLEFPPGAPPGDNPDSPDPTGFIIEMGPLELVPHSVHLFLHQVGNKLWDGTSFYRNPSWGVVAGPRSVEHIDRHLEEKIVNNFHKHNAHQLSFPEYSPHFKHRQFHLGFLGRPGGPEWYIDAKDNYKVQRGEDIDPCFGKVVAGFDAVSRIYHMPSLGSKQDASHRIRHPVRIVSMSILG